MSGLEWEFNDALFLTALGLGRRGRDLSELIGSADAFNHDVLPADQAARAVGRLIASGLVERNGRRFRLTTDGNDIYKRRRGGMSSSRTFLRMLPGWRADDLWKWALEALHIYAQAAADRTGLTALEICGQLAARHDVKLDTSG